MRITAARKRTVALAARGIALHQLTLQKPLNSKFLHGQKNYKRDRARSQGRGCAPDFLLPYALVCHWRGNRGQVMGFSAATVMVLVRSS
jgi:hypothetical protein